ncbi:3'-5' exonuclease [Pseudomonas mediterranea]|uniref:3'-5' exonuclease n=1 Tax=Pseudomonas mediterranea TaxID=183795 RepID=UPI0006D8C0A0|nr:3'-5' exonuclease [Pseudomonas mediterranea]
MTRDISIDLESLSLEPNAMILAIGAVEFNRTTGELGNTFYRTIDITAKGGGGVMDPATVKWWMEQSQEARDRVFADPEAVPLAQALIDLSEWLGFDDTLADGEYPDIRLWQRGDKDGQWLACAYDGLNLNIPYRYNQISDQRSITDLFPQEWFVWPERVEHDALSDAMLQAEHLAQALAVIQPVIDAAVAAKAEEYRLTPEEERLFAVHQDTLKMAYACGLTRVDEAIDNIRRHAMQLYPYPEIPRREKDLEDAFVGYEGSELVLDYLTPENKAKVDRELEELAAKPLPDEGDPLAFEEVPPCDLAGPAKEALKPENQRVVPPEPAEYRCECYVCGEPNGHSGMPCPKMKPTA